MKRSAAFFSVLFCFGFLFIFSSCNNPKTYVNNIPPPPPPAPEVVEQIEPEIEESLIIEAIEEGPRRAVGQFKSVKGIMDPLSCYCNNGGYVNSPAGETVAVCFNDDVVISSVDFIEVNGLMTNRSIESNGSCPSGTKTYMIVETYSFEP